MTLRDQGLPTPRVAVGVTHADAAALFAASTADDVFLATYEEATAFRASLR